MGNINWSAIFEILPEITGLPWKRRGKYWYAPCYMDGSPSNRHDKLVASMLGKKDGIAIMEQGSHTESLLEWLRMRHCGGDYRKAFQILDRDLSFVHVPPPRPDLPSRFVNPNDIKRSDLRHCNLFRYICTIWDEKRVREAFILYDCYPIWNKYAGSYVTTFLYKDEEGRICYDKQIKYGINGRRDKEFGGGRFFTTAKGYRNKTYFGSHLWGKEENEPTYIVESEKSAIIFWLRYNKRVMATGGSNCLREVKQNYRLLPDYDEAGQKWIEKHPSQCVKWWDAVPEYDTPEGSDFSDYILWSKMNGNNEDKK